MTTQTINLPNQVIDSEWRDDVDYVPYEDEKTYISPESVDQGTLARIKKSPVKLAIRNMVNWDKIIDKATA